MSDDDSTTTRIYLDTGQYVRASETIGDVAMRACDTDSSGFFAVEDPGDGREKLIRAARVVWIEQEAEDAVVD